LYLELVAVTQVGARWNPWREERTHYKHGTRNQRQQHKALQEIWDEG